MLKIADSETRKDMRATTQSRWVVPIIAAAMLVVLAGRVAAQTPTQAPPTGFRGINLGMGIEQVKTTLAADPLFRYRGDPDVSFLPQASQYLIECEGNSYLSRAYFQFAEGKLFIAILVLDTRKLDHYSLWSALSAKYGKPTSLDPVETVWQSPSVRFSLERPLTVKYVDNAAFAGVLQKGAAEADLDRLSREKFIEQF
jgi:hypothetical protein